MSMPHLDLTRDFLHKNSDAGFCLWFLFGFLFLFLNEFRTERNLDGEQQDKASSNSTSSIFN